MALRSTGATPSGERNLLDKKLVLIPLLFMLVLVFRVVSFVPVYFSFLILKGFWSKFMCFIRIEAANEELKTINRLSARGECT